MGRPNINWDQCLEHAVISDIGMRRATNQDAYAVNVAHNDETWSKRGHVFLVADGMGAHAAGELASQIAADTIPHLYLKHEGISAPDSLRKSLAGANAEIHRRGQANYDFHNMGTTCSVLTLLPQGAVLAHIGDSRIYRLRGDVFAQLTFDHSLVWEMRASGHLDDNVDLANILPKNVITRSLGPNAVVKPDLEGPFPIELGDTFLLCSDGLTGKVADEEIGPILANLAPAEAVKVLVDLANLRGGPDNITVIVAKVTGPELTTEVSAKEPIRLGEQTVDRAVHPVVWFLIAGCFICAAAAAMVYNLPIAILAALSGLVLAALAAVRVYQQHSQRVTLAVDERLGRGPYVEVPCVASVDFVNQLSEVVGQLREAAIEQQWDIDWLQLDAQCRAAKESADAGQHAKAVRDYARSITFLMDQLRLRRGNRASDLV